MTCIVGLVHDDFVYMGGDSAGVAGLSMTIRKDVKVFRNEDFIMGFTSSFRMGQLLQYSFKPPYHEPRQSVDEYLRTTFIDEVRESLKQGGYARTADGADRGGTFLIAYDSRLFTIDSDFQVGEPMLGYDAVGCGDAYALGSLFSTEGTKLDPRERIMKALETAETFSAGVQRPFTIISS